MFEKLRARIERHRTQRDQELISHGANLARHYEFTPVRCTECDTFGPVTGAVVARGGGGVFTVLDWRCAQGGGCRFIPLSECIARAAEMGLSAPKPRQRGYLDVGPTDSAVFLYNADTKSMTASHAAFIGSGVKPGKPTYFKRG